MYIHHERTFEDRLRLQNNYVYCRGKYITKIEITVRSILFVFIAGVEFYKNRYCLPSLVNKYIILCSGLFGLWTSSIVLYLKNIKLRKVNLLPSSGERKEIRLSSWVRQTALFLNTVIAWRENLLLWISRQVFERLKHIFVIFHTL